MASPVLKNFTQAQNATAPVSPSDTAIGDLVIFLLWSQGTAIPTHTLQAGFTLIRNHNHDDGTTDGRLTVTCRVATVAGAQSYTPMTASGYTVPQASWGVVTVTGADTFVVDPSAWVQGSFTDATANAPNPPSLSGLTGDMLILAIGAWHVTTAGSTSATVMANYSLKVNGPTGSHVTHLALASREMTGLSAATEDPAIYTDNVTPNGTAAMTIAVPASTGATPADNFNRTDTISLGGNWTNFEQTWNIVSNEATPMTVGQWHSVYWTGTVLGNDHYSEVTVGFLGASSGVGPMVRMKTDFSYYWLYCDGSFIYLQKAVAGGSATTLTTITQAVTGGDVIRLEVEGTTLRSYYNTVLKDTRTDTSIPTSNLSGFFAFPNSAVGNATITSWSGGNVVAAAAGQPTMRRWGGIPTMLGGPLAGRTW